MNEEEIKQLLESLTGQSANTGKAPLPISFKSVSSLELGYSQLNELLLLFGFDRITHAFFQFLLDGETEYVQGQAFRTADQLRRGVDRFRELAVLIYGNVKFAFKSLSRDSELLISFLGTTQPIDEAEFSRRHAPVISIEKIDPEDAYLTGYLIERELKTQLQSNPTDTDLMQLELRRSQIVSRAQANQRAYLASDHLDVYVATSMRERHEFATISQLVTEIFSDPSLAALKLRWFDPTQAHCDHRIDKGLSEALMLRRAQCTIYLAQESDTLGKDSELASTLAQGKPVVAFVPELSDAQGDTYIAALRNANPLKSEVEILLKQLQIFEPRAAWDDPLVRGWCAATESVDLNQLRKRLVLRMRSHYDSRAKTLCDSHPLGIQVNLTTGVANGVLVVRKPSDCARLVRNILLHCLEFDLIENVGHTELREKISGCTFRVVTHDVMLTNTFWNFYLDPAE